MAISIVNWSNELSFAKIDKEVDIKIATLLESNNKGTYITVLPPGSAIKPHYHQKGNEEYHIIKGKGVIRLLPVNELNKDFQLICKHISSENSFIIPSNVIHQLINNGNKPLTLIFSCPLSHLKEDRIIVENLEDKFNGRSITTN